MKALPHKILELLSFGGVVSWQQLEADAVLESGCSSEEFQNAIKVLYQLDAIGEQGDKHLVKAHLLNNGEICLEELRRLVWSHFIERVGENNWGDTFQYDVAGQRIVVDSMVIPWALRMERDLLLSVKAVSRESSFARFWWACEDCSRVLLTRVAAQIESLAKGGFSPSSLELMNSNKVEAGSAAEDWVVARERRRLARHPLMKEIKAVGQHNLSLGYDVVSFSTTAALTPDRFLEVKSFSKEKAFFLSDGELRAAREYGQNYYIVLVDRGRMSDPKYEPQEIRDPYNALFTSEQDQWEIQRDGWYLREFNRTND